MLPLLSLSLGLSFVLGSVVYLSVNSKQRNLLLDRFHLRRSRSLVSLTPPRSLSPAKQGLPDNTAPSSGFEDVFPPCRRSALAELDADDFSLHGKTLKQLSELPHITSQCTPDKQCLEDEKLLATYTPTGFTLEEIKALDAFPDYATLSGVPLPTAYPEFDITKAIPRPYRPIRWAYHQTMSLTKLEPDWWLELESTYVSRIQQRQELYAKHGSMVLQQLPGSEIAIRELMEMCLQFLCARYPHYFSLSTDKTVFYNRILNNETDLKSTSPLHVLLENVPEDFAITLRNPETGLYSFRSGVVCSSLGWNVGTKIGKTLQEIHAPIPDYKEKMQFSMDR